MLAVSCRQLKSTGKRRGAGGAKESPGYSLSEAPEPRGAAHLSRKTRAYVAEPNLQVLLEMSARRHLAVWLILNGSKVGMTPLLRCGVWVPKHPTMATWKVECSAVLSCQRFFQARLPSLAAIAGRSLFQLFFTNTAINAPIKNPPMCAHHATPPDVAIPSPFTPARNWSTNQ